MKELMQLLEKKFEDNSLELHIDSEGYVNVVSWSSRCNEYTYLESFSSLIELKNYLDFHKNL